MREKAEILQVPSPLITNAVYKYGQRWIYYVLEPCHRLYMWLTKLISRVLKTLFFFINLSFLTSGSVYNHCLHCHLSLNALSPSGKAQDFDSCIHWFKSSKGSFVAFATTGGFGSQSSYRLK